MMVLVTVFKGAARQSEEFIVFVVVQFERGMTMSP